MKPEKTREEEFRNGKISILIVPRRWNWELDIATLNIVHLRNVPPNPSNYAHEAEEPEEVVRRLGFNNIVQPFPPRQTLSLNQIGLRSLPRSLRIGGTFQDAQY